MLSAGAAAHCARSIDDSVQIGRHNISDPTERYERFKMIDKVIHPLYKHADRRIKNDYDYMILRLLDGSSTRSPVKLDTGSISLVSGGDVVAMGWEDYNLC